MNTIDCSICGEIINDSPTEAQLNSSLIVDTVCPTCKLEDLSIPKENKSYIALFCTCEPGQWKDCVYFRSHSTQLPDVCKHEDGGRCSSAVALTNKMVLSLQAEGII